MSGRVNLADLREAIEARDVYIVGADDSLLPALVDAVGAAHELAVAWERRGIVQPMARLRLALERLDLGEEE